eukprot:TRINITY_DN604_c0_g1_i1.p1 TRINITY_DN604_c0_g1~~TRINITY_DN604_c0_g1_i1.p1  ORF type:complete len:266 (-),score=99.54 TRINITY_DN604_c0_g1_i1:453-1250(-)
MNLFGRKKKEAPSLAQSIQTLRDAMETLDKREAHLNKQMNGAMAECKKQLKTNKRGAMFQLKRKKMFEKQVEQIYGKKQNLELQIMTLEAAAGNTQTLLAMKQGAEALKASVKENDIDKVSDIVDDIQESMQLQEEMSTSLAQPIGPPMDEDELEEELKGMMDQIVDEQILSAPVIPEKKVDKTEETEVSKEEDKETKTEVKESKEVKKESKKKVLVDATTGSSSRKSATTASTSSTSSSSSAKSTTTTPEEEAALLALTKDINA